MLFHRGAQPAKEYVRLAADPILSPASSAAGNLIVFNNALYFTANDGTHGIGLWKCDGTNATRMADINPGYNGSYPQPLSAFNDSYMFQANDALHGDQLWRLDPLSSVFRITQIARKAMMFPLLGPRRVVGRMSYRRQVAWVARTNSATAAHPSWLPAVTS